MKTQILSEEMKAQTDTFEHLVFKLINKYQKKSKTKLSCKFSKVIRRSVLLQNSSVWPTQTTTPTKRNDQKILTYNLASGIVIAHRTRCKVQGREKDDEDVNDE